MARPDPDLYPTAAALIAGWRRDHFHVDIEQNAHREPRQRWSCEVEDSVENGREYLIPRSLGYVCGYGPDATSAVLDANHRLETELPED